MVMTFAKNFSFYVNIAVMTGVKIDNECNIYL